MTGARRDLETGGYLPHPGDYTEPERVIAYSLATMHPFRKHGDDAYRLALPYARVALHALDEWRERGRFDA